MTVRSTFVVAVVCLSAAARAHEGELHLDDQLVAGPFNGAVGMAFDARGRMYVWERVGRLWTVDAQGFKSGSPVVDISEEVGGWGDHGLLTVALAPDVASSGHLYLLYMVDYHHLMNFGTPAYDPQANQFGVDSILRLTRYTMIDPAQPSAGVDPQSRLVLVGATLADGIPACASTHGEGSIVFGEDGSLLVSAGDGYSHASSDTCLADGILEPKEDVARYRAQLVDGLNGKVLRLDPATGAGLASNPFFDAQDPFAPRSRVWQLGLRNPFRMSLRPGTGNPDPAQADPGTLFIGDVGSTLREELNVAPTGGLDFGWPMFEGHALHPLYASQLFQNLDAPNPLFGQTIHGVGPCTLEFFYFQQLLRPEHLSPPPAANPCDPTQAIPPALVRDHTGPVLVWDHTGAAYVKRFSPSGAVDPVALGSVGAPVVGESFEGNCVIGGTWYSGQGLPPEYDGTYFFGDFGAGWIRNAVFDAAGRLAEVRKFADAVGPLTHIVTSPSDDGLYYVNLFDGEVGLQSSVRRIRVVPDGVPSAIASADVAWGPEPLTVAFDASESIDPEGGSLGFEWDFGDGTPRLHRPDPIHIFPSEDVSALASILSTLDTLPPFVSPLANGGTAVLNDGVFPDADTATLQDQFHTHHLGAGGLPEKGGEDWIAYVLPEPRELRELVFQEGMHFPPLGGWFETLDVHVRDATSGQWTPVEALETWPAYPGENTIEFETFEMRFTPVVGDAIRVYGAPGGAFEFVTAAELRVVAAPLAPVGVPTGYTVLVDAIDPAGTVDQVELSVSINNTPPVAKIMAPFNGAAYPNDVQSTVDLIGIASDPEFLSSELACQWRVYLHHDNHVHPEALLSTCTSQALLLPHGLEGDSIFYELQFAVTDPAGLSTTRSHWLVPDTDCNLNGADDFEDILTGVSLDLNGNGRPDECDRDCNRDGLSDIAELVIGLDHDCDENGVPDSCQKFPDCDGDGVGDVCSIALYGVKDLDQNGIPDVCDIFKSPDLRKKL